MNDQSTNKSSYMNSPWDWVFLILVLVGISVFDMFAPTINLPIGDGNLILDLILGLVAVGIYSKFRK